MQEAKRVTPKEYGVERTTKLNGKDILSQAAFEKQKMNYDRSHEVSPSL